jgi:hypothetical protein
MKCSSSGSDYVPFVGKMMIWFCHAALMTLEFDTLRMHSLIRSWRSPRILNSEYWCGQAAIAQVVFLDEEVALSRLFASKETNIYLSLGTVYRSGVQMISSYGWQVQYLYYIVILCCDFLVIILLLHRYIYRHFIFLRRTSWIYVLPSLL